MYKNARKTKVSNIGKDIEGSARHIRGGEKPSSQSLKIKPNYKAIDKHSVSIQLILRKLPNKIKESKDQEESFIELQNLYKFLENEALAWESKLRLGSNSVLDIISECKYIVKQEITNSRKRYKFSSYANSLIYFHNNALSKYSKRSVLIEIKNLDNISEEEYVNIINKNKSVSSILNKKEKKEYFTRKKAYGKSVNRIGDSIENHKEILEDNLVGLQWGNYVSDKERLKHLNLISESLYDLSKALDVSMSDITRGKLSLAVGARGRGSALAHYEPSTNCINLTKKNGFGSLAHEFGHFFDKEFTLQFEKSSNFITSTSARYYKNTPHEDILMKWDALKRRISSRIIEDKLLVLVSSSKRKYWLSGHEIFARCFERYVKFKLSEKNIINDYLVCEIDHPLWCNDDELLEFNEIANYIIKELRI